MLKHLTTRKSYAQLGTSLEHLTTPQNRYFQLAKLYLISCQVENKSQSTITSYSAVLKRFIPFVQSDPVTASDIRLFILSLQQAELSPHTIHLYYRSLKAWFNWLVAEDQLEKSPMLNVKPPKLPRKIIQPLTTEDVNNYLLLTSGKHFVDIRNRAILLVFIDSGVRLSELVGMKLEDLDIENGYITVTGKGNKQRVVFIGREARKALLKYLVMRKDSYPCLWVTEESRPIGTRGIQIMIQRLSRRAGITVKKGPHTFRHTSAVNYLMNGGDLYTLSAMLGHTDVKVTENYLRGINTKQLAEKHKKYSPVDNFFKR